MLKIHRRFSLTSSHHATHPVALSTPIHEDDELIQAIENDHDRDSWTLSREPDVVGLENFWAKVEDDISHDPTWFQFADE